MLSGYGTQAFLTKKYLEDRKKVLEDRTKYSNETLEILELDDKPALGGGRTDSDNYKFKQFPFPINQSIRRRREVDIREDPKVGGY